MPDPNADVAAQLAAAIVDTTKAQSREEAIATVLRAINILAGAKSMPREYEALLELEQVVRDDPAEWRAEPVRLALARIGYARR